MLQHLLSLLGLLHWLVLVIRTAGLCSALTPTWTVTSGLTCPSISIITALHHDTGSLWTTSCGIRGAPAWIRVRYNSAVWPPPNCCVASASRHVKQQEDVPSKHILAAVASTSFPLAELHPAQSHASVVQITDWSMGSTGTAELGHPHFFQGCHPTN